MTLTSYFYIRLSSSPSTLVQQTTGPKASSCRSTSNTDAVEPAKGSNLVNTPVSQRGIQGKNADTRF